MGIIRIMLFASVIAGTLAAHTWPRQSESQGEIIHSSPGSWESTITQEPSMDDFDDFLEKLCQEGFVGCSTAYSGGMFPQTTYPCGRKCP